jgi:ketosteroid isomerase-like protein
MTRNVREIFASIDAFDPAGFVPYLTEDVVFRFGNNDPAIGREAVLEAVTGFFSMISGLTHHVQDVWEAEPDVTIARIDVEYRRQDGEVVYTPNVDILRWDGDLVADWQIVIDLAPVFMPMSDVPNAVRTAAPKREAVIA